jgi:hypothetical protein
MSNTRGRFCAFTLTRQMTALLGGLASRKSKGMT